MVDMRVNFAGIPMKNPVAVASGTFGFGFEYLPEVSPEQLGAVVVKGLTLRPRPGNSGTRLYETPSGLLNSIGLQNPGIDHFLAEILPDLIERNVTTMINISGNDVSEYVQMAEKIDPCHGVSGIEVNVSCPNVKEGGLTFGVDAESTYQVVKGVRQSTHLPVIVKLTPNVTDIVDIAKACEEAGADGLSLINTVTGMAVDIHKKKPIFDNVMAGLSGPAIKPIALKAVFQVSQKVQLPVMGMGGIMNARDAIEMMLCGAACIAVGTANFVNPAATLEILEGLEGYMMREGCHKVSELTGLAWNE